MKLMQKTGIIAIITFFISAHAYSALPRIIVNNPSMVDEEIECGNLVIADGVYDLGKPAAGRSVTATMIYQADTSIKVTGMVTQKANRTWRALFSAKKLQNGVFPLGTWVLDAEIVGPEINRVSDSISFDCIEDN